MRQRSVTIVWLLHPSATPPNLRDALAEQGLVHAEVLYGMARDLRDPVDLPKIPDDVLVEAANRDDFALWSTMVTSRYGLDPTDAEIYREDFNRSLGNDMWMWNARRDSEPLAKLVLHADQELAGIYGVATLEAGRGQGLATNLTSTALMAAQQMGCDRCVLHSTPMAHDLYERLGFRDVAIFELWAESPILL